MFIAKKTTDTNCWCQASCMNFPVNTLGFLIIIMILHEELFQMGFRPRLVHCWISQPLNRNTFTDANLGSSFIQEPWTWSVCLHFRIALRGVKFLYNDSLSGFQGVTGFNFLLCKLWLWSSDLYNCTILANVTLSYKTLMCILMPLYWFFMKVWALHISAQVDIHEIIKPVCFSCFPVGKLNEIRFSTDVTLLHIVMLIYNGNVEGYLSIA